MVMLTLIGRLGDGLILATSIEGDEEHDHNMVKYTNQAKLLFRKLNSQTSPPRHSLESGPYLFHYVIRNNVCYLCLCDRNFPPKMAFAFLDDISNEFHNQNGNRYESVTRPYHFIEFDQYIQQAKRKHGDRQRMAMTAVSGELQDVARLMVSNIEDVLHRGESLNILDDKATNLAVMSKKYRQDAIQLNRRSTLCKAMVVIFLIIILLLIIRYYFW